MNKSREELLRSIYEDKRISREEFEQLKCETECTPETCSCTNMSLKEEGYEFIEQNMDITAQL